MDSSLATRGESASALVEWDRNRIRFESHLGIAVSLDFPLELQELPSVPARFLKELLTDEYPYFAVHLRQHIDGPRHSDSFEFVLDLILEGLERGVGAEGRPLPEL